MRSLVGKLSGLRVIVEFLFLMFTYINMQFALTINTNFQVNTISQNNTYTYRNRRKVVVILLPSKDATFL
jgi:hypothetical protein